MIEIYVDYAFGADFKLYTGSSISVAINETQASNGVAYTYSALNGSSATTVWIVSVPDSSGTMNPNI
jgi:hypothetical protein